MSPRLNSIAIVCLLSCIVSTASAASGPIETMADYLVANQLSNGNWGEQGFVGETTIGMARAYTLTGAAAYKTAAENAGDYILWASEYNPATETYQLSLFAAEAYALTQLSEISDNPEDNPWRTAAEAYFQGIADFSSSTESFIDTIVADYGSTYIGTAVYDIARLTAAAGYVNDPDLDLWRGKLVEYLGAVPASESCPTTALASAVWALSLTGGLDAAPVPGAGYLSGNNISELPQILAEQQASDGSFYWYFDQTDAGYVEPTALAELALQTVGGYELQVNLANTVLAAAVEDEGTIRFLMGDPGSDTSFYFTGEVLEVLTEGSIPIPGPIERAADYLAGNQLANGTWGEDGFVGEAAIGLARAYSLLGKETHKTAAEEAGDAILWEAEYNAGDGTYRYSLYAAETYALTWLSDISADPADNRWRTAVNDYFADLPNHNDGTQDFIDSIFTNYGAQYIGTAVYDIARFTVSAHYASVEDLSVWRSNLMDALAEVKADSDCPTTALAAAVWGLSLTGGLDDATLSGSGYLNGATLSELPQILEDLQFSDGSFFWDFDQNDPGYIEPTVMAKLALETVGGYDAIVESANVILYSSIEPDGAVNFKLGDTASNSAFYFSGEMLETVTEAGEILPQFMRGDGNADGTVDISDPIFVLRYLFNDGTPASCMDTTDANDDGKVDIADAVTLIRYLFGDIERLPMPFGQCGYDPTDDDVTCNTYTPCDN